MNCKQIAVVVFILALVAPSIQYGTIFTDRITPALADSTYFSGLKTEEVFTTDAGIGRIVADNKLGFSINTPGPINSNSNSLSFVASQGIDFSSNGETNLVSSGQINLSGSTGAFGVTNLDFVGSGDILFGGLRSIVRGNTFALNSVSDTSLVATGDELLIKAPQEILFSSVNDTNVLANNNIELISLYETNINADDITLRANYIQNDGSAEFYATNINTTITAGSIVEINSAAGINATIYENYEIIADAGDIHVSAPELLSFAGTPTDLSEFEFSGNNNLFIVNRATTESTIDLEVTGSLTLTATNQINFANFFGESDWSLDASGNTTFTAPSISFTTARGQFVTGDQLTLSSSGDFTVNVPSEDLYANAIQGGITLTAQQGRFVGFTRDLLSITANDIISDTVGSTTYASATGDVLFRQINAESDGTLSVVVEAGLLANATNVNIFSAGKTAINTANGTLAIRTRALGIGAGVTSVSQFGAPRQVTFDADRNVTLTANSFVATSTNAAIITGDYRLTEGGQTVNVRNSLEYTSGGDTSFLASVMFLGGKSTSLVGTSSDSDVDITVGSGGYTQFVYATENRHSSVDITTDGLSYTASSRFSTVSNDASITGSAYNDAARVVQFLVGQYTDSADVLTITAGEAVYLGQNLPDDTLSVNGNLVINGQFASIQAGGNVIIDSDDFVNFSGLGLLSLTGTREFNLNSGSITIAPNAETSFLSGGALTVNVNDQFTVITENDINVQGPNGENGQVTFSAGGPVTWDAARLLVNSTAINWESSSLTVETDSLRFLGTEGEDAFSSFRVLTLAGPIEVYADEHLTIQSRLGIYHADNEVDIDTTEYLDIVAQQLEMHAPDQISVDTTIFTINGGFSPPPQGPTNPDARLVWLGDDLVTQVDSDLNVQAGDHISFASGNNLAFDIVQDVLITSGDQLFIDASELANVESTDLQVTSTDGELNLLSGGAFTLTTLGSVSATSNVNHQWESYTLNALVQGDSTFTATAATVRMVARDGMVRVQSDNTHASTSGANTEYTAAGSVLVKASTTVSTVDNGGDITIDTIKDGGDIIFDSEGGNEVLQATGDITHTTGGFTNYKTAQSIRFNSGALTTTTVADSFDWKAMNDVAITAEDLTMVIGGDAHKEVGGSVSINSQNDFSLTAGNNFLASTGEQGKLGIFSGAPTSFVATTFQRWRASGDFTWAAEDLSVTSTSQDISMFTTGGALSYTGTDFTFTTVEDLVYRSGDYLRLSSGTTGSWTATTTVQTLSTAGNVILDAGAGELLLKATNDIDITSGASRDPQDGIRVKAGSLEVTAGTSFNLLPTNYLNFGGETTPTSFKINAAGSATVAGVLITSEGDILTKSGTTTYNAFNFGANVRNYIGYDADDLLTFNAATLTVTSDAGSFHNHVDSLTWSVTSPTGNVTSTSNTGVTEFISRNRVTEEDEFLTFNSDDTLTVIANSLVYNIGEEYSSDTLTTVNTVTNNALFGTTAGGQGDLSFESSIINIQSKGSIRGNVLGADGTLQFSSAALTVETRQSGDVIFRSAGGYYGYAKTSANFVSNTQFTIESLSIDDGNDFTNGDVVVRANDITLSSGDTFTVTSQANVVTYATGAITDTAVTGLAFNSNDDTIFTASGISFSADEDLRTDTVLGNDGNLVFTATGANPSTLISFTLDDSIFNFNGNVLGQADNIFRFNTDDGPLAITTSATGGNIRFEQHESESNMAVSGTTLNVDLTGTFSTYSYLDAGFTSQTGTLNFTAFGGNSVFNTTQGNVIATIVGPSTFTSSAGQIKVGARGISPRSEFGIEVLGDTTAFAAVNGTVTVNAYEAIELRAASEIYIGTQINTANNALPEEGGQTLTLFISRGHNADIVYNTREPLDGNGNFQIAALGNLQAATPAQFVQDRGNNDFVADADIQLEFESGLSFIGLFKTPANNQLQSDVYFYANQDSVTVETTNTGANIVLRDSVTLFDADERLSIIGNGESGSTINFNSDEGGVFVRSQSTDLNDGISVHSYNGRITLDAKPDGSLLFVGQNNVRVVGEKGVTINTGFTTAVARTNLSFRASSGHVNIRGLTNTFTANTINIGQALSSAFGNNQTAHTGDVFFNTRSVVFDADRVEWTTQTGNVDIEFGSFFDMRAADSVVFSQNPSLAVPMKQETITPGTFCTNVGEFAVAHNSFLASDVLRDTNIITNTKDTGAMLCLCTPRTSGNAWFCRAMSQAYPFP